MVSARLLFASMAGESAKQDNVNHNRAEPTFQGIDLVLILTVTTEERRSIMTAGSHDPKNARVPAERASDLPNFAQAPKAETIFILSGAPSPRSVCFTRRRSEVQVLYRPPLWTKGKTFSKTFVLVY